MRRIFRQRSSFARAPHRGARLAGALRSRLDPLSSRAIAAVFAAAFAVALLASLASVSPCESSLGDGVGLRLPSLLPAAPGHRLVWRVLGVSLVLTGLFAAVMLELLRAATAPLRVLYRNARRDLREKQRELDLANERFKAHREELQRANAVLARLSITDDLTRLHNHRFFRDTLPRELKRSLRTGESLALVLFDIDDFKTLNDRFGHSVGDAILARVAGVMREAVRGIDLLARYGGEEFALLAPGTSEEGAVALAEKVRLAVANARFSVLALEGPQLVQVSLSAGVAVFGGDDRELFHAADRALYRAKASGKDCVVLAERTPSL